MSALTRLSGFVGNVKLAAAALNGTLIPHEVRTLIAAQSLASAGIVVTPDLIFRISAAHRAITLIATTLATCPMIVSRVKFEQRAGRTFRYAEEAPDHPWYQTLRFLPSREMDAVEYWETVLAQVCVYGEHYSFIGNRSVRGEPKPDLIPLSDPKLIERSRDPSDPLAPLLLKNRGVGRLRRGQALNPRDWFGVRWISLDGQQSGGLLDYAQGSLSVAAASQNTFARFLANGMMSGGIASPEAPIGPKQWDQLKRIIDDPDEKDSPSGWRNAGKLFVPPFPMKILGNMVTAKDSELIEARRHEDIAVGRFLGIPAFMFSEEATRSSIATVGDNQFTRLALRPWASRVEAAVQRQLIRDPEFEARFDLYELERGNRIAELEGDQIELETAQASPNELRARKRRPPAEGGDKLFIAGNNLVPLDGPFPQQVKMEQTGQGRRERRAQQRRETDDDDSQE